MSDAKNDTRRALLAAQAIFDGRHRDEDGSSVLVTTEHAVATVLLAVFKNDAAKAALMLNEGLVPGIEERLAAYAAKK